MSLFAPPLLPDSRPFYKVYVSFDNKPFDSESNITQMLQSRISSLTITRRRSTSKAPTALGEATITLREPLDESFFLGLPGVGLDEGSKKALKSARFGIKIGYRNINPLDLIGTGRHYYKGKFLPSGQAPESLGDLFMMRPSTMAFIGKLGMPSVTGSDKGEFSGTMRLFDVMANTPTLYDPISKFTPSGRLTQTLMSELKISATSDKVSKRPKPIRKTYTVSPAIIPTKPSTISPLLLFKTIFDDLFRSEYTIGDESPKTISLDMKALIDDKFILHNVNFAMIKNSWTPRPNQNRYEFFKEVLNAYGVDFFLRYNEDAEIECVLYPKGYESFVYLTPIDQNAGFAIPSPLPFAINAIYGLNVTSFDFTPDQAGPSPGMGQAVSLSAKEPGNPFKEDVVLTFSQDKMNKWVESQKAANKGMSDFDNIALINQKMLEMQAKAGTSAEDAKKLYDAWYEKGKVVNDPAMPIPTELPALGQNLKLKFRHALPGLVPGMFVNFEGLPSKAPVRSLAASANFKPANSAGTPAKKSNNIPDVIAGRYCVNEVTFSFQPNAVFTMEVSCSR